MAPSDRPRSSRARFDRFLHRWRTDPMSIKRNRQEEEDAQEKRDGYRKTAIQRYKEWLWPRRWSLVGVFLLGLVGIGCDLIWPLVSMHLIDEVILDGSRTIAERRNEIVVIGAVM